MVINKGNWSSLYPINPSALYILEGSSERNYFLVFELRKKKRCSRVACRGMRGESVF
jgi:hypothetical protein